MYALEKLVVLDIFFMFRREILGSDYDTNSHLNKLFKGLESNSVLFVLNETELFKSLKHEEVIELLEKQPFIQDGYQSSDKNSNEINIFLSFTILKRFINLIIGSISGTLIEHDGVRVPFTNELIKTYLMEIKLDIAKVEPIALRIEVLENLFSLLFIRKSDLKDQQEEDIDVDIVEDISIDSSMSRSLDSLSTIMDDPVDSSKPSSLKSGGACSMDSLNTLPSRTRASKVKQVLFAPDCKDADQTEKLKNDIMDALLEEIDVSPTDTLKPVAKENPLVNIAPSFLVSTEILQEVLSLLTECLLNITNSGFRYAKDKLASGKFFFVMCIS